MARITISLAVALSLLLGGCGKMQGSRPVRVGFSPRPAGQLVRLAYEKGVFDEEGLNVHCVKRGSALDLGDDLVSGKIDIAVMTLYEAVAAWDRGVDVIIPLVIDYSRGADGIVARKQYVPLQLIKGKKVGVQLGSVSYFILVKGLEKSGLREADVTMIDVPPDETVEAFAEGIVDAVASWDPHLTRAAQQGDGVNVYTSTDASSLIADVLVVRKEFADRRPRDVENVLKAWFRTVHYFKNNYAEAVDIVSDADGLAADVVKEGFEGVEIGDVMVNREAFGDGINFGSIFAALDDVSAFMRERKLLKRDGDAKKCVLPSFFFKTQ
ncbi:MAG TPA: ABC transporter substrate-binding protein [bacterium]|nr:ABC transporter substrate-binding protein [bacterium]